VHHSNTRRDSLDRQQAVRRYLGNERTLDLVAQYHSRSGDVAGYCAFIEALIERHGEHLATPKPAFHLYRDLIGTLSQPHDARPLDAGLSSTPGNSPNAGRPAK
jgi:hypothetical protein